MPQTCARHITALLLTTLFGALLFGGCGEEGGDSGPASVEAVSITGDAGAYSFATHLRSPDTGCGQYADWWEVVRADGGALLYRRILTHSHVEEQPFTRSGGPVAIPADQEVVVRVHMNNTGYSDRAMRGSARGGFRVETLPAGWGAGLERVAPQPDGCAF